MNDLEHRIREELHDRAGVPQLVSMPPRTLTRIRRRQALIASFAAIAVVGAVVVGSMLVPGSSFDLEPGRLRLPRSPLEEVPRGWPTIDVLDPSGAYEPSPAVYRADDGLTVVATGTADGYGFSYLAWTGSDDPREPADGPCVLFAGPSSSSRDGAGAPVSITCGNWWDPPVPEEADLIVTSQQDSAAEGIGATFGFVSPRVSDLVVAFDDGSRERIPILRGDEGWGGIRTFLLFGPEGRPGVLSALDGEGTVLAQGPICSYRSGSGGSCTLAAEQLATVPSVAWPRVEPGVASAAYIDLEADELPSIVGKKRPVLFGEVSTPYTMGPVAFSTVVWESNGSTRPAGLCLDFFLGYRLDMAPPPSGADRTGGGSKSCSSEHGHRHGPLTLVQRIRGAGPRGETVIAMAGLMDDAVAELEIVVGSEVRPVVWASNPLDPHDRVFVAFPPLDAWGEPVGTLVARGAAGEQLWATQLRSFLPGPPPDGATTAT